MDEEALLLEQLPLAQAARNSGGIVIAQVKHLALAGSMHPKHVRVPAPLVDYLVVAAPAHHAQTGSEQFSPALSGDIKVPMGGIPALPLNQRLVVCRRAAMELLPGAVVNLGYGIPDGIGASLPRRTWANCSRSPLRSALSAASQARASTSGPRPTPKRLSSTRRHSTGTTAAASTSPFSASPRPTRKET